jgi:hypothetical protein
MKPYTIDSAELKRILTPDDYISSCEERNRQFKEKNGREMNYDDVIASFGGRPLGCSQVLPRQRDENKHSRSMDNAILDQT